VEEDATAPGANIDWALQDEIGKVATAADAVGADDPAYTVSFVDVRNARLIVYRTSSATDDFDLQRYLTLAPAGVSIAFEAAALSATEIENLNHLIAAMRPEFEAAGVRISGWWPDYASGMRIQYSPDAAEIPQSLRAKVEIYGPGTVRFQPGAIVSLARFHRPSCG